jgi:hypothetical protein
MFLRLLHADAPGQDRGEHRAAVVADADHPAAALDDLPDQREPEAAPRARGRGLRGDPVHEDGFPHVVGHAGARVAHPDQQILVGGDDRQLDPSRPRGLGRGVDRVVDQVPRDGKHLAGVADRAGDAAVIHDPQPDVALVRERHLRQDQRHELGVLDAGLQPFGEVRARGGDLGHELDRLVVATQLDEPDQGVQPVGELVRLGAQRIGQAGGVVQLPLQRLGLGAVLEGDHPAEVAPAIVPDRHPVGHEHPVAVQHQQVAALHLTGHHVGQPARGQDPAQRAAREVRGQVEQRRSAGRG